MATPRPLASVNVTPLIDVLLVLLIVFMVIVPEKTRSLDVRVPETGGRRSDPGPTAVRLSVGESGFALNDRPVSSLAELASELAPLFAGRADRALLVQTSNAVPYGTLVDALDVARGAGAVRIGLLPHDTHR
jgi:biopolymer transport protein ExbD